MASKSNAILVASAAVTATYLIYSRFFSKTPHSAADNLSDDEIITPDLVCKFFDQLFVQMQSVLANLSQQIAQIQAAGQRIPEDQLKKLLAAEFERGLGIKQQKLLDEMKVDEDCMQEAMEAYLARSEDFPAVQRSVERFRKLYTTVAGDNESSSSIPDKDLLSASKVVEAAEVYFEGLTGCMRNLVNEFKEDGLDVSDPSVSQKLQNRFAATANDAGDAALKEIGIDADVFKKSLEKHSQDAVVGRALAMLQMKQQQDIVAMGISPGI